MIQYSLSFYAKTTFDISEWSQFFYKKSVFASKTVVECGALCKMDPKCNVYLFENKICYHGDLLGEFEFDELTIDGEPTDFYVNIGNTVEPSIYGKLSIHRTNSSNPKISLDDICLTRFLLIKKSYRIARF